MYLPAPSVEHDKWLFAALVFFPVKLLILRFCEASEMMLWFPSCSGAPRAEAGWKEGWGWGWRRLEVGMDVWGLLLLRNKPSHSLSLSKQLGWNNYIGSAKLSSTHCERRRERVINTGKDGCPFLWATLSRVQQLVHYLQLRI